MNLNERQYRDLEKYLKRVDEYVASLLSKRAINQLKKFAMAKQIYEDLNQFKLNLITYCGFLNVDLNISVHLKLEEIQGGMQAVDMKAEDILKSTSQLHLKANAIVNTNENMMEQLNFITNSIIAIQNDMFYLKYTVSNSHIKATDMETLELAYDTLNRKEIEMTEIGERWCRNNSSVKFDVKEHVKSWMISSDEVKIFKDKRLGGGASADVYLGSYRDYTKVAVKLFKDSPNGSPKQLEMAVDKELENWRRVSDEPFVLTLIGACTKSKPIMIVSEYCPGTVFYFICNLYLLLTIFLKKDTVRTYTEKHPNKIVLMLYQIACGLRDIHSEGIIHRDLKTDNILVNENGMIAIADFGMSRVAKSSMSTRSSSKSSGTLNWMSPEQRFTPKEVGKGTDVWSFAMTAYELFSGLIPYHGYEEDAIREAIRHDKDRPDRPGRIMDPKYDVVWNLIEKCWKVDPGERPSFEDIVVCFENNYKNEITLSNGFESSSLMIADCHDNDIDNYSNNCYENKIVTYTANYKDNKSNGDNYYKISNVDIHGASYSIELKGKALYTFYYS